MLLLVYAFIGFEGALIPAGEAKKPKTDMPVALIATLVVATGLYFLIQSVVVSTLPLPIESKTPLVDSANWLGSQVGWNWFGLVLGFTAIISIFGNLLALMFAAPRMTVALAQQKQLPTWFEKYHLTNKTPTHSIYFLSVFAMILAVTKGFVWLAIFSSLARLIGYLVCVLSLPVLHQKAPFKYSKSLIILLALVASIGCIWLIAQASSQAWIYTGGFFAFGAILYWLELKRQQQ